VPAKSLVCLVRESETERMSLEWMFNLHIAALLPACRAVHSKGSVTLAESCMADRLQAGRSGLQMSSWPGTVIPR